jgi:hypothetical protein
MKMNRGSSIIVQAKEFGNKGKTEMHPSLVVLFSPVGKRRGGMGLSFLSLYNTKMHSFSMCSREKNVWLFFSPIPRYLDQCFACCFTKQIRI